MQDEGYGANASEENVHHLDRGLSERRKHTGGITSTGADVGRRITSRCSRDAGSPSIATNNRLRIPVSSLMQDPGEIRND